MNSKRFNELNETFNRVKLESNSFTLQVRSENVNLFAGILDGDFSIALTGGVEEISLNSTNLIHASNRTIKGEPAIVFSLKDSSLLDIFISFSLDLETIIQTDKNVTILEVYNRYLYWQKMFKLQGNTLSESVIKGLINELNILNSFLIPKYGVNDAIRGWIGSEGTVKDFSYSDYWYEAKAINKDKEVVEISSLAQLDSNTEGQLLISEFEKTARTNDNAVCLYDLFTQIKNQITQENYVYDFYNKIIQNGLDLTCFMDSGHEVNDFCYLIHNVESYIVNDEFPRLTADLLPKAIGKVKYELLLSEIESNKLKKIK